MDDDGTFSYKMVSLARNTHLNVSFGSNNVMPQDFPNCIPINLHQKSSNIIQIHQKSSARLGTEKPSDHMVGTVPGAGGGDCSAWFAADPLHRICALVDGKSWIDSAKPGEPLKIPWLIYFLQGLILPNLLEIMMTNNRETMGNL